MIRLALAAALLALPAAPAAAQAPAAKRCAKPVERPFQLFNALSYADQPDLAGYGLSPIHVIDRGIWAPGASEKGPPDPDLVRRYVDGLSDDAPIVLDFESFELGRGEAEAQAGVAGLGRILQAFRAAAPGRKLGFYGYLPQRDYWRAIKPGGSAEYRAWQRENDRARKLAAGVDLLFPSIYTFYPDQPGWAAYASAQICEARRLSNKPVYVFLWPNYHASAASGTRLVAPDYWRLQLETAYRLADGAVIWGGWDFQANRRQPWDPSAAWWAETLRFLRRIGR